MTDLTPETMLTTTRAVRRRLDLERPVERSTVEDCLRLAFQAPNGGNMQRWSWVLVDDPDRRVAVADIYRAGMDDEIAKNRARYGKSPYPDTPAHQKVALSVAHLREHLHEVPVLVIPTVAGRMESADVFTQASVWGSILPGIWSFMLALRTRGMGSAWTTVHLHREREMADLLGIPFDTVTQAGLFPVAYTIGTDFRPADRSKSDTTIHWNHW